MPWLIKDQVLFIHVPRCGGTSITKHHRVGMKARSEFHKMDFYHRFGLIYYYYRYRLLETQNFPVLSFENLWVLFQFIVATFLYFFLVPVPAAPYIMWATGSVTFIFSTFIWTAPVTMRNNTCRRALMYFQYYILCKFGCEDTWMVGTNNVAYLFHITGMRAIKYGYVTKEDLETKSFSIIRNPYSRAVSMYEYNKRPCESFDAFIDDFYMEFFKNYIEKGSTECRDIYCHVLPMYEYTHIDGKQTVACIIKQEKLKHLLATEFEGAQVPPDIANALTGIPHANKRSRQKPWQDYYSQKSFEKVHEMYAKDFEIFDYPLTIAGRPDLALKGTARNGIQQVPSLEMNVV